MSAGTACPEDGFLGEELGEVWPTNKATGRIWVIDPNDGTSWFLQGRRGAAVSIALLVKAKPVLGVVFAYNYPDDNGDLIAWAEGGEVLRYRAGERLQPVTRAWPDAAAADTVVLLSPAAEEYPEGNTSLVAPGRPEPGWRFIGIPSLAYRLALCAVGGGDAGGTITGAASWDVAGGPAILRGAGDRSPAGGELYGGAGNRRQDAGGRCGEATPRSGKGRMPASNPPPILSGASCGQAARFSTALAKSPRT